MTDVVIFGTSEFAEIVYRFLLKDKNFNVVAFTVHEKFLQHNKFQDLPVIAFEKLENEFLPSKIKLFVALGYTDNNKKRESVFNQVKQKGYSCISYVDSSNTIGDDFECGENCFIFENNVLQPSVKLGDNVIVWSGNLISHHTIIKNNCFVSTGSIIGGHVTIENNCFLGLGSIIRNSIKVDSECVIGAGAVILENTNKNEVYVSKGTVKLDISSNDLTKL